MLRQGIDTFFVTLVSFFLFCHIGACLWYLQATFVDSDNGTDWIHQDPTFIHKSRAEVLFYLYFINSLKKRYISSLYFVIATTVTVGYGDIHAGNTLERYIS